MCSFSSGWGEVEVDHLQKGENWFLGWGRVKGILTPFIYKATKLPPPYTYSTEIRTVYKQKISIILVLKFLWGEGVGFHLGAGLSKKTP